MCGSCVLRLHSRRAEERRTTTRNGLCVVRDRVERVRDDPRGLRVVGSRKDVTGWRSAAWRIWSENESRRTRTVNCQR